ncbi:MAG TPA: metallophosphoesterase family protein [Isosphaeraceae bacterium]|jgi:putative phosphoesterase|nr:metallophosphoesterase family protein [Isosphaeraceae bacterium]
MKLGLIADIHADIRALEATLRWLDAMKVRQIVCAGDLVGYGTQADAAVALIRDRGIPSIRGNHDRWALERKQVIGLRGWRTAELTDDTWAFLATLPASRQLDLGGRLIEIHHGSPSSDTEFVSPYKPVPESVDKFWSESDAKVLILGHTHIPMIDRTPRGTIINPGSVMGVTGIQTSYSFGVVDLESLAVRIFEVRTGREIRRDPVFLADD